MLACTRTEGHRLEHRARVEEGDRLGAAAGQALDLILVRGMQPQGRAASGLAFMLA
jgi:hypothetical protein